MMRLSLGVAAALIVGCCLTGAKPAPREKRARATVKGREQRPPARPMRFRLITQEEKEREVEARLARWKPGPEERDVPMAAIRNPSMEVAGKWMMSGIFRSITALVWTPATRLLRVP